MWHNGIIREKIFKNEQQTGLESESQPTLLVVDGKGNMVAFWRTAPHAIFTAFPTNFSSFMGHDVQFLTYPLVPGIKCQLCKQ